LRSSGGEPRAFGVWARQFARKRDLSLAGGRIGVHVATFQAFYPLLCSMTLYFMIVGPSARQVSTGVFLAFSAAFTTFLLAVLDLVSAALQTVKIIPLYERASPILRTTSENRGASVPAALRGAIELSHVSFRYEADAPLVLDDLNLRIEPGEFVAVVGPSGSGKSTLLRVLLGFDNPSEGGVFYDGQALSGLDMRGLRQQIGVVLQHSRIMAGDILNNIVGSSGRSLEDAWRAARLAAFDKDIEAMPMGMHTVLAQGGGTLSGGQRQRLLIARALAAQPRIMFLDEATSALDNRTQADVSASLDQLRVTRVVIAHRLSTIQQADRIVVLDRGRIVQQGRFEHLLQQGGTFGALARRQLA
jgi:ABC-type bacteriocin/lantibiotic exporter with double-glycine peptidase domain